MYFDTPVLLGTARLAMAGRGMKVKTYGERAARSEDTSKIPAEVRQCKEIARILFDHYPGHPWSVEVDAEQGYAFITIPPLLGANWGYILHLDKLGVGPEPIIEAGGHLLERFRIPRSTVDIAAYSEAENNIPLLGNFRASRKHRSLIPS
jgi:hypothetical protein